MYKLMIADDEPLIRRGIKQLIDLSSLQIGEIYEASTGEEALKVFEEFEPEIVLMDINMPKIDGLSVAKKIKSINSATKIAIITGYNYFDYAQTAIKIGVEDYILKPISKKDVSEIIVKLVSSLQEKKKDKEIEKVLEKITTDFQDNAVKNNYKILIQNIIENNYSDSQFTLSVLSEKLDLSSGYISIMFKKNFGIPFQDYLLQKRMEKAKLLLLTTELKNYEIAEQVGFEDVNYFITKFKKYYQITPKQYKEMVLKNENEQ
ncbi:MULTISPECIES: response regulator transcription factor [Fusobacterium]|uniref:response regulator transcription factor n=2 Tax=Fusobacteriaceae TaxID=203492 RepID=UPI0025B9196C|nr:response regulator [Fusobacterium sp.]MCI7224503.1 response regulator [Fusobacterium sp.]MDD7410946.1 response regulator [Fusobacteriaceae bacterium]MDY5306344.1 response regulator [Fusobacterium gastrosuis]MDY5714014.1 response regulator [Fusobacterium gastrosuis]